MFLEWFLYSGYSSKGLPETMIKRQKSPHSQGIYILVPIKYSEQIKMYNIGL